MSLKPTAQQKTKGNKAVSKPRNEKPKTAPSTNQKKENGWLSALFNLYNILFLVIALIFLSWSKSTFPAYKWVQDDLLKGGYENCIAVQKVIDDRSRNIHDPIEKQRIATDTKYEAKIGVEYIVLKQIRDMTPPDAIILFPPYNVMTQKTSYLTLRYELTMKAYSSYFLYPRTIVYEQEKGKNPLFDKAQYVFLLHGWGFNYLGYEPKQRNAVDILPIHRSNQ
jgi:hypothetical protein